MIHITFKNLDKSEMAREAATGRIESMIEKFPDLTKSRIDITLEMDNSPTQAGPDLFHVKVHISGGRYDGIRLEKSAPNLYLALADVVDRMLEKLNRYGDRARVRTRNKARKQMKILSKPSEDIA